MPEVGFRLNQGGRSFLYFFPRIPVLPAGRGLAGRPGLFLAFVGAADQQVSAHERLVVKNVHGADGIFQFLHFHEGVALGFVSAGIVNDFHGGDFANALEHVFKVAFRSFVGEVAHIQPAVGDRLLGSDDAFLLGAGHPGICFGGVFVFDGQACPWPADAEDAQETLP